MLRSMKQNVLGVASKSMGVTEEVTVFLESVERQLQL